MDWLFISIVENDYNFILSRISKRFVGSIIIFIGLQLFCKPYLNRKCDFKDNC